jgi:hypothetical protein
MKYRLLIESKEVEVETPELSQIQILLNKQFEALENPSRYHTEFSRSIQIPFSSTNNKIFSMIFNTSSVVTNKTIDPRKKLNFVLLFDNEVITKGYAKVSNIYDDQKNKYYVLNLFSSLGYIFNEIKQFTFSTTTDIDKKYVIENPLSDNLVINKQLVKEAFEKTEYELDINKKTNLDYITFFPQYQGKYSTFSSNKMEIGGTIYDIGGEYDEHETREFRSYMQGCGIWLNALIQLVKQKIESISDYKVILSKEWFNASNPYWKDLLITLPTLYKEDSENIDNIKKENYKVLFNQYKYNILSLSDLSNSHKQILPFQRSSGDYIYDSQTKRFNMPSGGSSCHFHEQLNYTLFIADVYEGGFGGYCRIKDDNCLYLTIKAIDAISGADIVGASTTYMFYSNENDRLEQTHTYDHAIDIGITARNYPNAVTNADVGYEKDKGFYWQGDLVADFEVRTSRPFVIVADIRTANNSKLTERAISEYVPQWDWLWVDNWQSNNSYGYTNGLTFFITCVNAEMEHITSVRSNSALTMERIWGEQTIYEVFMNYLKQFHLMVDLNEEEQTITIGTKEKYFSNYSIDDWSNRLDRTKNLSIQPIFFNTKYLVYGYNNGVGQRYDYYQKKYDTSYGSYKVDNGYEFNNNETLIIEDLQPSMICTKKQSSIHNNTRNPNEANFKGYGWKHYPNEVFPENDSNGGIANNYYSYYFHNGVYSVDDVLSQKDVNNKPYVLISDDTEIEIKQNAYCWNNSNNVKCYSFPLLSTYDKSGKYSIHFAEPKELYFNKQVVPYKNPKGVYNLFWERYLNEIYNIQNKVVTANFYIEPYTYKQFKFNQFIVVDNVLYRVIAIKDYDISSTNSTKVEMIQVADITAYTRNNFDLPYLFTNTKSFTINEKTTIYEEVFSSGDWSIQSSDIWLNCYKQDNYLVVDSVLPSIRSRFGIITIQNTDGLTYTITLFQEAIESFLTINKNNVTFERIGGTSRINVETYPNTITIVEKPNWVDVTINKNSFGLVLIINTNSNNSRMGRSGNIVISNGYNTETIRVGQQATTSITTTTTSGEIIVDKPIVIERGGTTTITTTMNKPINPNTIVISNEERPFKPTNIIGDIELKITPQTEEESDGGRLKIYSVDGKPLVIDYNVGKVDTRYTIYIQNACIINGVRYDTYYDSVLEGTELNIEAVTSDNKIFDKWSDDNTDNPRQLIVDSDITIYPIFKEVTENIYSYDDGESIEFDNNELISY